MPRRRTYRRRRGTSTKTLITKALAGMGVGSLVGGGVFGALGGYLLGGLPGAIGGLLGENLKGMFGQVTQGLSQGISGVFGVSSQIYS